MLIGDNTTDIYFKFYKVVYRHYSGEIKRLFATFTQKSMYQISAELPEFYGQENRKHFSIFFPGCSVHITANIKREKLSIRAA